MKSNLIYSVLILTLASCDLSFLNTDYNDEGYRDGSDSGALINKGSLVGSWEETYEWRHGGGESHSDWSPVNVNYAQNYVFLEDGTFTSTQGVYECSGGNGTYTLEGTSIKLNYTCEEGAIETKTLMIDEFFFREKHIVFIQGDRYNNISKLELVKEN